MEKDDNIYGDNDEKSENNEIDEIASLMDQCEQTFGGKSKKKKDCIDQGKIAFKKFLKDSEIPIEKTETITKLSNTKLSQAQQLIKLANESAEFFHTPGKEAFAIVKIGNHEEIWSLQRKEFKLWLRQLLYESIGKPPNNQALRDTLLQLEGDALFNGPTCEVFIRFAAYGEAVYIDMANDNWEQIEITRKGWQKISGKNSPVKFMRTPSMQPIAYPKYEGQIEVLENFLNVDSMNEFLLIVGWLIGAMQPNGPFPILLLQGEQGSAKSTTARLLRSIIDPSTVALRTLPRSERDLIISASKSYVLNFDNLSGLPDWLSDALCRIATGSGFGTRTLYSDDSEMLFNASRPIIINGISDIATRHDLADRCLTVQLPPIRDNRRMTEKEFWNLWQDGIGVVQGALFNAISSALQNIDSVKIPNLPRMADFAKWVTAAEFGLQWENGSFVSEYEKNRSSLVDTTLEADPVATAILQLVKQLGPNQPWSGTPSALLGELSKLTSESITKLKSWPKQPNIFSNKLNRAQPFLRQKGIEIERSKSGDRNITIRKTENPTVQTVRETVSKPAAHLIGPKNHQSEGLLLPAPADNNTDNQSADQKDAPVDKDDEKNEQSDDSDRFDGLSDNREEGEI